MVTSHNGTLGYGITSDPQSRLQDYVSHSAAEQEMVKLYYGEDIAINVLENYVSNQWKPFRKKFNGWLLEWLDPIHNLTVEDMVTLVEDKIKGHPLSIKRVNADFLPFTNYYGGADVCKENINLSPDTYLTQIV